MKKRTSGILEVTFWAVSAAFITFCIVIPAVDIVCISFRNYDWNVGLWESPWVGFSHYRRILDSIHLPRLLRNSLCLSILGGVLPVWPGWLIGRAAGRCPSDTRWIFTGMLLLPAFLPPDFLGRLALTASDAFLLQGSAASLLPYLLFAAPRTLSLTAFLSAALGRLLHERGESADEGARLGGLAVLALGLMQLFSPDTGLCRILCSSQNYEWMEVLSTAVYRSSGMESRGNLYDVYWVLRMLVQLPGIAAGAFLLMRVYRRLISRSGPAGLLPASPKAPALWGIIGAAAAGIALGWIFIFYPGWYGKIAWGIVTGSVSYTVLAVLAAAVVLCVLGWLGSGGRKGVFPALCLAVPLGGNVLGFYHAYRAFARQAPSLSAAVCGVSLPWVVLLILLTAAAQPEPLPFSGWMRHARPFMVLFLGMAALQSWMSAEALLYFEGTMPMTLARLLRQLSGTALASSIISPEQSGWCYTTFFLWLILPAGAVMAIGVLIFAKMMDARKDSKK